VGAATTPSHVLYATRGTTSQKGTEKQIEMAVVIRTAETRKVVVNEVLI